MKMLTRPLYKKGSCHNSTRLDAAAANTERPSVDERAVSIAERSLSKGLEDADMFAPSTRYTMTTWIDTFCVISVALAASSSSTLSYCSFIVILRLHCYVRCRCHDHNASRDRDANPVSGRVSNHG